MQNNGTKILIVEDEQAIADNIIFAVETEGMRPTHTTTAAEAWQVLQTDEIHLIVLDIGLPDENGFDLCRRIRAVSTVPIIFLTARSEEIDRIVGLELGADDYVAKPFSPRELTARIRAILRRTQHAAPSPSVPEPMFKIDQKIKTIFYHGQALNLSRYEFRMLERMIPSPGQVFSREQLMDYAWEEPDSSCDRTVDTHIKTLRGKLREINPASNCLETRRGFGYFLKESE
jgi:two-component system, OmpR family, catabolic regulation response regulator CreB